MQQTLQCPFLYLHILIRRICSCYTKILITLENKWINNWGEKLKCEQPKIFFKKIIIQKKNKNKKQKQKQKQKNKKPLKSL